MTMINIPTLNTPNNTPNNTPHESNSEILSETFRILGRVDVGVAKSIALYTLLKCLDHPNLHPIDRPLVITALGQLKDPQSIDPLIQQLTHPAPTLRLHILHALQQIDAPLSHDRLKTQSDRTGSLHDSLHDGIHFALTEWRC